MKLKRRDLLKGVAAAAAAAGGHSVTVDIGPKPTVYYEPPENIWRRVMAYQ